MVIKKRKDTQANATTIPVPDVSMNPEVIKNWKTLAISVFIYIEKLESHKENCSYFAETGKARKEVGGLSRKDHDNLKSALKAKAKADLQGEMTEAKLNAKDHQDPVSVNLRMYDKLTIANLKDLLKTRGLMHSSLEDAKRKAPLILALNAADKKMYPSDDTELFIQHKNKCTICGEISYGRDGCCGKPFPTRLGKKGDYKGSSSSSSSS